MEKLKLLMTFNRIRYIHETKLHEGIDSLKCKNTKDKDISIINLIGYLPLPFFMTSFVWGGGISDGVDAVSIVQHSLIVAASIFEKKKK